MNDGNAHNAGRGRRIFSVPLFYLPVGMWAVNDDGEPHPGGGGDVLHGDGHWVTLLSVVASSSG